MIAGRSSITGDALSMHAADVWSRGDVTLNRSLAVRFVDEPDEQLVHERTALPGIYAQLVCDRVQRFDEAGQELGLRPPVKRSLELGPECQVQVLLGVAAQFVDIAHGAGP